MVRQLDVIRHPIRSRRDIFPYLIILQHDRVKLGTEVIVAPLAPPARAFSSRLQPLLEVEGRAMLMMTHQLGPIAVQHVARDRPLSNLEDSRYLIIAAIDLLFAGS